MVDGLANGANQLRKKTNHNHCSGLCLRNIGTISSEALMYFDRRLLQQIRRRSTRASVTRGHPSKNRRSGPLGRKLISFLTKPAHRLNLPPGMVAYCSRCWSETIVSLWTIVHDEPSRYEACNSSIVRDPLWRMDAADSLPFQPVDGIG